MNRRHSTQFQIVSVAKQLFAERGFHRTAVSDIAEEAGVSVGAVYRSFAAKSDIIMAIVENNTEEALAQMDGVAHDEASVEVMIEQLIVRWLSCCDSALNHEFLAEAHRNSAVADIVSTAYDRLRERLRDLRTLLARDNDAQAVEGICDLLMACFLGLGSARIMRRTISDHNVAAVMTRILTKAH